jgi:hypothetical protein
MLPLSTAAVAVFVAFNSFSAGSLQSMPDSSAVRTDSIQPAKMNLSVATPSALSGRWMSDTVAPSDTVRKPRQKAFVYSDGYETRLTIHRRMSWAMLPLFAASYFSGQQILDKNTAAPKWARNMHGPAATGAAVLFTANTITGAWNLWEGRHDPNGRTRRILHSVLFTAASAGFVYAGSQLANDAEQSQAKRLQHRNVALASMGVSTFSWLIMLIGN